MVKSCIAYPVGADPAIPSSLAHAVVAKTLAIQNDGQAPLMVLAAMIRRVSRINGALFNEGIFADCGGERCRADHEQVKGGHQDLFREHDTKLPTTMAEVSEAAAHGVLRHAPVMGP